MVYKSNCRYFRGDIPCKPHKTKNVHCEGCLDYEPTRGKILIIKLGAAGDVIRTTPLLIKLKKQFPSSKIYWLTEFPDLVPRNYVDKVIDFKSQECLLTQAINFDYLFSLDKDYHATALASIIKARHKFGFILKNGVPAPINKKAESKYLTGLFDDVNKSNKKHYMEEIFEICGYKFNDEKYVLNLPENKPDFEKLLSLNFESKELKHPVIGLNTGCGSRWVSRLWLETNWTELAKLLIKNGFSVLLLGGPQEDDLNKRIVYKSGAIYLGTFPLSQFAHEINLCDLVVTQVTMAMHIAIALKKKLVLMNNIFNRSEFYMYGLGQIVEPLNKNCLGCFKNSCPEPCMSTITPERMLNTVNEVLRMK